MSLILLMVYSAFSVGGLMSVNGLLKHSAHRTSEKTPSAGPFNLPLPTLGGWQFWGDEMVCAGWRIQRNALTGHHRLLDRHLIRRAWGTYADCEAAFRRLAAATDASTARPKETVILLHGLFRTRRSMRPLETFLAANGYEVVNVGYASTRGTVEEHAAQLARVIERLPRDSRIHFVTHSLGGVIVRACLRDCRDPRIGRLVMLAPPSQGSALAESLMRWGLFPLLAGPAGRQLRSGDGGIAAQLPAPPCEFGVIAGGRGDERGFFSPLQSDNDGIVRVAETRLDGMKDFLLVPSLHSFIMNDRRVKSAVLAFLRTGRFAGASDKTDAKSSSPPHQKESGR